MVVQTTGCLGAVVEIPVPLTPRRECCTLGKQVVGNGPVESVDHRAVGLRLHAQAPALAGAEGVETAVRDQRAHLQIHGAGATEQAVADVRRVGAIGHPHAPLEERIRQGEDPHRKDSLQRKGLKVLVAVRVDRAGGILVRTEGIAPAVIRHPFHESANEHRSCDGGCERGHQESVVATGVNAGYGAGCVPAEAVGHEPLAT